MTNELLVNVVMLVEEAFVMVTPLVTTGALVSTLDSWYIQ